METDMKPKKIAFCITCMNRLNHLQQTLEKNIQDNYLPEEVEFILLDYNSKDGLGQWVYQNMQYHINSGILVYYKTFVPENYLRSHSRNMAFRLANADILCNLDADNFLGKGFAEYMLQEFSKHNNIFYTSNFSFSDIYGRICVKNRDFNSINGYNEKMKGWGYEDNDFQNRLVSYGLKPMRFHNPEFYRFVSHSDEDRISDELMFKNALKMYIAYINPCTSDILLLNKDFSAEKYTLIDNSLNETKNTLIEGDVLQGTWQEKFDSISIRVNGVIYNVEKDASTFDLQGHTFYKIQDNEFHTKLILSLSDSVNYRESCIQINENSEINPDGFGKGTVFKNFDMSKEITLS